MIELIRRGSTDQGTPGDLYIGGAWFCHTLELPWRENKVGMSCIPTGRYEIAIKRSPRFGRAYRLYSVPGRSEILIHSGNWAGDVALGYRSHVQGCILLGNRRGMLDGQTAVLVSKPAVTAFMERLEYKPSEIVITEWENHA